MKVAIQRTVEAEQFKLDAPLPTGVHLCQPEVHWSASRELVYFTYAKLRPEYWMGVNKMPVPTPDPDKKHGLLDEGYCVFTPKDEPEYARKMLPFAFWKVKSEASLKGDHRAVYLDAKDPAMMGLWYNYCSMSQWPNPIPRMAEFREVDGKYGRGFRPIYMADGDWLLREQVPRGHDNLGLEDSYSVLSDADFQALKAAN